MGVNKVILIGNLGANPEMRFTQGGQAVANLRIATSERWTDRNGQKQETTEWHRVVLFGKQADLAKQYLTKGREVLIEGSLRTRQWQDKEGQKRFTTEVVCQNMRFVGGRGGAPGAGAPGGGGMERGGEEMAAPVGADDIAEFGGGGDDSDIPF